MATKASFNWEDPLLLDQQLTEEERMVRDSAHQFAQDKLAPRVLEAFRHEQTDPAIFREMGETGLLGATIPEQYGGSGLNYVCYGLIAREVERIDSGYRSMMSVQSSLVMVPINEFGNEATKQKYLPKLASGEYIGDFQIHIPSVSVTSIGDGGGSIAWVDAYGVLKVGPHSAGSTPGPACFGRGGVHATITDAYACMGILGQSELGYNSVKVDTAAARRVVGELAAKLGQSVEHTAEAIVRVSVSGMYAGVNRLISRFGIDPRAFTLMPFGGAGPMLGCYVARALNMPSVMVPMTPGVLSALGGLIADTKNDFVKTTYYDLDDAAASQLKYDLAELETQARAWMADQAGAHGTPKLLASADMRYQGQSFEIDTALPIDALIRGDAHALREAFHQAHARLYGHSDPDSPVESLPSTAVRLNSPSAARPKRKRCSRALNLRTTPSPTQTESGSEVSRVTVPRRAW